MNHHTVVGIDLAKHVFQVAIFERAKIVSNRRYSRSELTEFLINSKPSKVFMEACYSAHYWGRLAERHGHTVGLIPAQHVKPFTRGNKNDANDAVAIVEASSRPNLRLVNVKSLDKQDIQSLHRMRERLVRNRTGLINQTHGLLAEYGLLLGARKKAFIQGVTQALNNEHLSPLIKEQLRFNLDELEHTTARIKSIEAELAKFVRQDTSANILQSIPGIGLLNASGLAAKYGDPNQFANARELAVHLGLTPRQVASGHRQQMLGISKRGDRYLRKQLIHGARALLARAPKHPNDALCQWAVRLKDRRGHNVAVTALARKLAPLAWTLLHKQEIYQSQTIH